jgi:hypothetical protein
MKKGIMAIVSFLGGAALGAAGDSYFKGKIISKNNERVNKFKSYYNILNQWIVLNHAGKKLEQYFINHNYKKVAVYGMGEIGNRLYEELKGSPVEIKYAIDKNAGSAYSELEVFSPEDKLEEVDAVIITTTFAFEEIKSMLENKYNCPIISLEDVVFEL